VTQKFDNIDRIDDIKVPLLIAHGTQDSIVPFSMGEKLFAAARAPKRFFRADGGSHHNLTASYFDDYKRAIVEHFALDRLAVSTGVAGIAAPLGAASR